MLVMMWQIKVKTLTGKEIEIDIENDDTIARIKVRLYRGLLGAPCISLRINACRTAWHSRGLTYA